MEDTPCQTMQSRICFGPIISRHLALSVGDQVWMRLVRGTGGYVNSIPDPISCFRIQFFPITPSYDKSQSKGFLGIITYHLIVFIKHACVNSGAILDHGV